MTIFVKQRKHNWELDNWNVIHDISMNGWIQSAFPFCLLPFLLQHLFHITLLHAGPMIHSIAFSVHSNEGQYNHFCPLFNSWKRIQIKTFLSALFQEVVWTQELHYEWEKSENLTLHLFQCYSDEDIQSLYRQWHSFDCCQRNSQRCSEGGNVSEKSLAVWKLDN